MFSADEKGKTPQRGGTRPPAKDAGGDADVRADGTPAPARADTGPVTPPATPNAPVPPRGERNIGDALRRVYQDAASEDVPDDLLDLLRKLG